MRKSELQKPNVDGSHSLNPPAIPGITFMVTAVRGTYSLAHRSTSLPIQNYSTLASSSSQSLTSEWLGHSTRSLAALAQIARVLIDGLLLAHCYTSRDLRGSNLKSYVSGRGVWFPDQPSSSISLLSLISMSHLCE